MTEDVVAMALDPTESLRHGAAAAPYTAEHFEAAALATQENYRLGLYANAPLKRGSTGVCSRSTCLCAAEGLGDECIWLVRTPQRDADRTEPVSGSKA